MAQLRDLVEVVGAFGLLHLEPRGLDLLAQLAKAVDRGLLLVPLELEALGFLADAGQLLAQDGEPLLAGVVLLLGERGLLDLEPEGAPGELVQLLGHRVHLGADHRAGLVDKVDRLVGEEAVGNVAVGQDDRVHERVVLDLDAVVELEALPQAAEDGDRVLDARLLHEYGLEAALQRRVLLDVLPVLVKRRGPDAVELPPGEHGLEQVAGVHRAVDLAGPDDQVQLVDEEDHAAVRLLDLVQHGLQALLELPPVLGAGDKRAHVEREHRAFLQALGHVAAEYPLGEALDDRRLADAGLADQDRVVLGLSREDPDRAADLVVAADDRVELPLLGPVHQVHPVLLKGLVGRLRVVRRDALVPPDRLHRAHHLGPVEAEALEELLHRLGPAHLDEAQKHVLDADEFILERLRVMLGLREHVVHGLGHVDLRGVDVAGDLGQALELAVHGLLERARGKPHLVDEARDDAVLLAKERREQVPRLDLVMVETAGDRLGVGDGLAGHLGELVEIHPAPTLHRMRHRRKRPVQTAPPHGPPPGAAVPARRRAPWLPPGRRKKTRKR